LDRSAIYAFNYSHSSVSF